MSSPRNTLDTSENPNDRLNSPVAKKEKLSDLSPEPQPESSQGDDKSSKPPKPSSPSHDVEAHKSDKLDDSKKHTENSSNLNDQDSPAKPNKDEESPQNEPKDQDKEDKEDTPTHKTTETDTPADNQAKNDKKERPDPKKPAGIVDMDTFGQILEMDEDESDRDFSHGIVVNFYEQAHVTFEELDDALKKKDLHTLHTKGHFLKGSSAALGLIKVKASCEAIQVYGRLQDPKTHKEISEQTALQQVEKALSNAKDEYEEAEGWLKAFYDEQD
ncbi:hypothetical protein E3P92_02413 [Wallemia ichthyophaga]|uniref:HPt domain-containing protein n=2 Tax=Wallemia ichthyophaga TaxID=245174 RepID=A0A4T0IB53_WALIC|nr:Multistep phosphorelay regulator 1 [Wallemia ichthyophaga EXF-994]TIA81132.1 hypothetical protein E3P98_02230 [Wallemia ichthyophaga]EOQ99342.1 Multistep phosphorelay regulator 1 [Wallemia ichthyophaga EXF-994]TIA99419.1 hypothetical protein E3P95_02068 [Wallemia ichthyophaga]TIB00341.1 hypothetical protein E3P94_02192 [Wallemia ichthyophaga]TIB11540.1 hypothetical protein E3P90_02370 [Wallemia ichthyophaga]